MPELPEVETVKESLKKIILNKKISNIEVFYDRIIQNISVKLNLKGCLYGILAR